MAWGGISMATQFAKNGDFDFGFEAGDFSYWKSSGGVVDLANLFDNTPNAGIGFLLTGSFALMSGKSFNWNFSDEQDVQVSIDKVSDTLGPSRIPFPVPEPATIFLSGVGLLGMGALLRKRRNNRKNNK